MIKDEQELSGKGGVKSQEKLKKSSKSQQKRDDARQGAVLSQLNGIYGSAVGGAMRLSSAGDSAG